MKLYGYVQLIGSEIEDSYLMENESKRWIRLLLPSVHPCNSQSIPFSHFNWFYNKIKMEKKKGERRELRLVPASSAQVRF